jgi:hypothetical protein
LRLRFSVCNAVMPGERRDAAGQPVAVGNETAQVAELID